MIRIATISLLMFACAGAKAETSANVIRAWGLLATWGTDCADPAKSVSYAIDPDGTPVYRNAIATSSIVAASRNPDGTLSVTIRHYKPIAETRVQVIERDGDGIRPIMSRNERNEYSIRDRRFVATGTPVSTLQKCSTL